MAIEIVHKNLFESEEEGIVLTIDGAAKGMEGNLARNFARLHEEAWEEVEYEISYPMPLGTAKVYGIHPDCNCKYSYCFIASTLNHLETLSEKEKLGIQGSAFRQVLSLAEVGSIKSIASAVMVGGWRLEPLVALENMLNIYLRAASLSEGVPSLKIYIMSSTEFNQASDHVGKVFGNATFSKSSIKFT